MRGQHFATLAGTAFLVTLLAFGFPIGTASAAAPVGAPPADQPKPVQTPSLLAPPAPADDEGDADGPPAQAPKKAPAAPSAQQDEPIPTIEYDFSKLPPPVAALRQKILAAAKTGDINALKPIMDAGAHPPSLGASEDEAADPIAFLKSQSGDPDGREILAILSEILEAGYVHVDAGTPNELYLWPYFARYPLDKLTPPQMVELFRLLTSSDFEEMKSYGAYLFYRVGITPDGQWSEFQAGD